eukprot:764280-Hanusia_phi.AAC.7
MDILRGGRIETKLRTLPFRSKQGNSSLGFSSSNRFLSRVLVLPFAKLSGKPPFTERNKTCKLLGKASNTH